MISKEEFNALRPGSKVRIVSSWPEPLDPSCELAKGLGRVMTIEYIMQTGEDTFALRFREADALWTRRYIEAVVRNPNDKQDDLPEDPDISLLF